MAGSRIRSAHATPIREPRAMAEDASPISEPSGQILALTRFAVIATLALAFLLLVVDAVGSGWNNPGWRFLSERVVTTLVYAIAFEVAIAVAAVTALALFSIRGETGGTLQR